MFLYHCCIFMLNFTEYLPLFVHFQRFFFSDIFKRFKTYSNILLIVKFFTRLQTFYSFSNIQKAFSTIFAHFQSFIKHFQTFLLIFKHFYSFSEILTHCQTFLLTLKHFQIFQIFLLIFKHFLLIFQHSYTFSNIFTHSKNFTHFQTFGFMSFLYTIRTHNFLHSWSAQHTTLHALV